MEEDSVSVSSQRCRKQRIFLRNLNLFFSKSLLNARGGVLGSGGRVRPRGRTAEPRAASPSVLLGAKLSSLVERSWF